MPMPVVLSVVCLLSLAGAVPRPCGGIPQGRWGSRLAELQVAPRESKLQVPCGEGVLRGPLRLSAQGRFAASGTFKTLTGVAPRAPSARQKARFHGRGDCKRLELTVDLADGTRLGPYPLVRGDETEIPNCAAGPPPRGKSHE